MIATVKITAAAALAVSGLAFAAMAPGAAQDRAGKLYTERAPAAPVVAAAAVAGSNVTAVVRATAQR